MDIAFDDAVADRVVTACRDAVRTLEGQRGGRQSATGNALHEFRGVFADAFRANVDAERGSRTSLVGILEGLAEQVAASKRAAAVERARLAKVAAWEAEHVMAYRIGGGLLIDEAPRPDTTPGERPRIYVPSARQSLRSWPGGGSSGSSSADPDDLEAAVTLFRGQDDAADSAGNRVIAAVGAFEGACSWVLLDADGIRGGFRRFVNDNRDDTTRLAGIAAAFRAAGGTGDIGPVALSNSLLVLAEAPASLSGPALLAFLSTATNADLKALTGVKGWQHTLQGIDPGKIAAWWAGMNPKDSAAGAPDYSVQQAVLLGGLPAVFGNLNGIPYTARSTANVTWLGQQLTDAKQQLQAEQDKAAQRSIADPGLSNKLIDLQTRIAGLESIQSTLGITENGAHRFLVGLTADAPPLAQVSIGNLDTATDVTYAIPGMGTTTVKANEWVDPSQNIYNEQYRVSREPLTSGRFAVVAWIGYKTPPIPFLGGTADFGVLNGDSARQGASRLGGDLSGFAGTRPDATLNVVAHSYGTTTATDALSAGDYGVDNLVLLASAGVEPAIPDTSALHAGHVYAAQAPETPFPWEHGDAWAWTGRMGSGRENPVDPSFGATVFGADGEPDRPDLHPTTTHDPLGAVRDGNYGYFNRDTESLYNTALATTGNGNQVTPDQSVIENTITGGIG